MKRDEQSLEPSANNSDIEQMDTDDNGCSDSDDCSNMDEDDEYEYNDNDDEYEYDDNDETYSYETDDFDDGDNNGYHNEFKMDTNDSGDPDQCRMFSTHELSTTLHTRISKITTLHNLRPSIAHVLLRHSRWNHERLTEALLEKPRPTLVAAGVSARYDQSQLDCTKAAASAALGTCPICFCDDERLHAMPCGHAYCLDCWKGFLRETMSRGHLSCFTKTCPEFKCTEIVTEEEVRAFVPEWEEEYTTLQLRAFADEDGGCRWCPSPGCDRIAVIGGGEVVMNDGCTMVITCDGTKGCGLSFCVRCAGEPHAPVKCHDLELWTEKNRDQSLTMDWVLLNTKKCGGCGKRIEKNQGCNHMTCKCGYEFCWVCGKEWKEHTGSYYNCNQFVEGEGGDKGNSGNRGEREKELDKYLHFYKRYLAHDRAQKFAEKQLSEILDGTDARMVNYMKENNGTSWHEVEFLKDANKQLVDCRRTLKFTYVFAYYMKEKGLVTARWNDLDMEDLKMSGDGGKGSERQTSGGSISSLNSRKEGKNKGMKAKINGIGRGIARQWSNRSDRSSSSTMKSASSSRIKRDISDSSAIEREIGDRQKEQFEYHQKLLEMFTEELSELVEKPVGEIVRIDVLNKTKVVAKYLSNILSYTEDEF